MSEAQWADAPFTLIKTPGLHGDLSNKAVKVATEMALAHNSFFRGLNAIYLQAPFVKLPADIADFLVYCQCWHEMVSHHHDSEEKLFFPAIAAYSGVENVMEDNIKAHAAFHEGLQRFREFVHSSEPEAFDGRALKRLIDSFAGPFEKHMREEIDSLLGLEKYGEDELLKAYNSFEAAIISTSDKYRLFPYVMGSRDVTFENGMHTWPPVPFFVPYIVHYYFERKHSGAWRFGPSDTYGKPRKLAFLPDSE